MNAPLTPSHIKELLGGKPFCEDFINAYYIPRSRETEAVHCSTRDEAERDAIACHDFPSFQYLYTVRVYRHKQGDPLLSEIVPGIDPQSEQDRRAREEASEQRWQEAETLNYQRGVL